MTVQPSLLFVFGLGYSALALADTLKKQGWQVSGTVRSPEKAAKLRAAGLRATVWDGEGRGQADMPPPGAHWLITLPPGAKGCPAAAAFGSAAARAASVTYLSTTGVYGDLGGGWAFEWTPVNPGSDRGAARVLAEQQWMQASNGSARLVRLPGIYGPERSPLARIRDGKAEAIIKPGQVFSRVHVEDIASGLAGLMAHPEASGVFHLCDDEPAPPQDVLQFAANLLGRPPLKEVAFGEGHLSPMARSFYAECKRVSNARAKSALGWRPRFRTYREGLTAIAADL